MISKKVDIRNKIIHVNNKPFFPIGARHIPTHVSLKELKKIGFNCFRWTAFGSESFKPNMKILEEDLSGLMFYPYLFDKGVLGEDHKNKLNELTDFIIKVKDHPLLLCYEQRNEPSWIYRDFATPKTKPDEMIRGSRIIKKVDPNHPIRIGHGLTNLKKTLKKYNDAADIIGCNPYIIKTKILRPNNSMRNDLRIVDCPNQTISAVGDYTEKMISISGNRAVWMQLQAMPNENWHNEIYTPELAGLGTYEYDKQAPTYWEMRFMAFMVIVRGAVGIEWSMYKVSKNDTGWKDVCRIINDLSNMQKVITSPNYKTNIKIDYKELGFGDWSGVAYLVKKYQKYLYIIAVNTQFDPMKVVFYDLPEAIKDTNFATVIGENRKVKIVNRKLNDWFQPYEVHNYKIPFV